MERLFFEFVLRASLIVLTTAFVLRALRIRIAAAQHAVWTGVLLVMLLLPAWLAWGPKAGVPVLPARTEPATVTNDAVLVSLAAPLPAIPAPIEIPQAPVAKPAYWNWNTVFIGAYMLGALVLLLRLAIGTIRANRLTGDSCSAPVTVGLLHPRIILPASAAEWSQAQLDAVLTHERAHARRRDPLFQWLALFNRAVFWFHPLAWWLERKLSALAEEACDAAVLDHGHDPREYSRYLLELARAVQRAGTRVNVVAMAMPGSYLPQRVKKIIDGIRAPRISPLRMASATLACAIPAALFAAGTLEHIPRTLPLRPLPALAVPQPPVLLAQASQATPARALEAAKTPEAPQEFEVAVIRPNKIEPDVQKPGDGQGSVLGGGQFAMRYATLRNLLAYAFHPFNQRFQNDLIVGLPAWADSDHFDVIGKAPINMPPRDCFFSNFCLPDQTLATMLQGFLKQEFKLVVHEEQRPADVYALVAAKGGPKLKEAAEPGERHCERIVAGSENPAAKGLSSIQGGFVCTNMTMANLAALLPEMAGGYIHTPVVDLTGLNGKYDFKLVWTGVALLDQGGITVFEAAEKQLGLKLENRKLPMAATVIDHIERLADDN
jgi:uncharacterized protein (TIGR03435 family)